MRLMIAYVCNYNLICDNGNSGQKYNPTLKSGVLRVSVCSALQKDNEEYKILAGAILFKEESIKNKYALIVVKNNGIRKMFNRVKEFIKAINNSYSVEIN